MPSAKSVWGIDVGQCALKAIKLQWRDGKLRPLHFDVIEHAKILSQPDADEQALIRSALGKFMSRNNIKGSTVVISVPGQASFTRFIKLPPVEAKKVPEIVRYEARQQIPFNLEDVVWDYQTISPPSAGPREVEVGIFAMKRDIVNDYVSDFVAMRIEPDVVQMAPVALYNFLKYEKKEAGGATLLIDVGAENTNLVIGDGERVWIRNVPLGGNNFTQALAKEFKLPFSKAETLKRHAAESKHAKQVFQAMRPVFGDLVTEIQRSIGYYTSLHRDSRIERVVALGGALRLAGLAKFISQNLGIDVQKVEAFEGLGDSETLSAPLFRDNVLSFGVSYGLALQGLGLGAISTSLLPPEILSQKVLKRKRPFFIGAAAAVLGAVACFSVDQMRTSAEVNGPRGEVAGYQSAVADALKKNQEGKAEFDRLKASLAAEQERAAGLRNLVAYEAFVSDLRSKVNAAWPVDPAWSRYYARKDYTSVEAAAKDRRELRTLELLRLQIHYVPDVRVFSELAPGSVIPPGIEIKVKGQPADPRPGVLVEIVGISPIPSNQGQDFVNKELLEKLRADPLTVILEANGRPEALARIKLQNIFSITPDYKEFVAKTGADVPVQDRVEKGNDFWFDAQWVVSLPGVTKTESPAPAAAPEGEKPAP